MNSDQTSAPAAPDYLERYALHCPPFENRVERKFFYGGAALMQRLDLLAHLTQFGEPLVLVIGPPGSGKTTMFGQFVAQANNRWYLCQLNPDAIDQLSAHFANALGGADTGADMDTLLGRWDTETDASQLFVIAIDDADQLDADACRTLCELLDKPQGERIRLLLFGTPALQPRLKETLAKLASTRSPQILEVPRLSEEESAAYLMYRLAVAGYSGESPFSTTEIRAICKAADGWPGAINQFADETLREHMIRTRSKHALPQKGQGVGRKQLWLAIPAILLVAMVYLGWQNLFGPAREEYETAGDESRLALPEQRQPESVDEISPVISRTATTPDIDSAAPDQLVEPPLEAVATAEPLTPEPLAETVPLPLPSEDQLSGGPDAAPAITAEPEPPAATEPLLSATIEPSRPEEADTESPAVPPAEPAPAAEVIEPPPPTATEPTTTGPHREAWLLEQPGQSFSLQLLGSRNEKLVADFIRQHKLDPAQTAYYRGLLKGSDWFVLMYGVYPSRTAAQQGLASLPEAVRKAKPWPRELKAVHQSIREAAP